MNTAMGLLGLSVGCLALILPLTWFELPAWLATGLAVSPLALVMLGITILEEATSHAGRRAGRWVLTLGTAVYGLVWLLGVPVLVQGEVGTALFGLIGGTLGLPALWSVVRPPPPLEFDEDGDLVDPHDPFAYGADLKRGRITLRGLIAVLGVDTVGLGAISLAFTAVGLLMVVDKGEPQAWISLGFFAGCAAVGVNLALTRWALFVPGPHRRALVVSQAAMAVGAGLMLTAIAGFAVAWPDLSIVLRGFFGGVALLGFAAVAVAAGRWLFGYPRLGSVTLVREGLCVSHRGFSAVWAWDDVTDITLVSVSGNPAVGILLDDEAVPQQVPASPSDRVYARRLKKVTQARGWSLGLHGADLVFLAMHLPSVPRDWLEEVVTLLADPSQRAELDSIHPEP